MNTRIGRLLTEARSLATHKDGFDSERRTKFDKIMREVESLEADVARFEAMESRAVESERFERSARPAVGAGKAITFNSPEERKKAYSEAFRSYALHGFGQMPREQRDLLTTGAAGALIPQDFLPVLFEAQKYYGPVATMLTQRVTDNNGAPMKLSIANDTANSLTLIAEGSSVTEVDPTFNSRILGVDMVHGGLVKVSIQELEDSTFNLDTWLREAFGKRYARGAEAAVTSAVDGNGTALPNSVALTSLAPVGQTTVALANGIGWTDLTTLYGALDPAYAIDPKWVMNSSTRSYLIGLKDGFGRPYFEISPGDSKPFQSILGFDIVLDQAMPNMGASAKPIIFGSLKDAAVYRTDGAPQLVRLNERYMDTLEVGFFLYARIGSASLISTASGTPNPLVTLQQAAS